MKVDCYFVEEETPEGKRTGVECSVCEARFFDRMSQGEHPHVLESGITKFINHANEVHFSTGGVIGGRRRDERRVCA